MRRKIISWTLVIIWMVLIFILSHQPAPESSDLSSGITRKVMDIIKLFAPNIKLSLESLHFIIRKGAHFSIYLILGILSSIALRSYRLSKPRLIIMAITICVLYAISDEIHQIFIQGRSCQLGDVLIDSSGSILGISLFHIFKR